LVPSASKTGTASLLRFDPLGVECYDCHSKNFIATSNPNHVQGNYSKNCTDCHTINSYTWTGAGITHDFFPLTGGHAITDCNKCHSSGVYAGLSKECISCHQPDYQSTSNPSHTALDFSTNCKDCHTTDPGWKPAEYRDHDAKSFPIYSGKHNGQWNTCADCHTNPANYLQFTCIDCHTHNQGATDGEHDGVTGYAYNSPACFGCHPNGRADGSFDHSAAGFPLTQGHASVQCSQCHISGYIGTSNVCASCHTNNYTQTSNPNHVQIGISNDCKTCHTTIPGWKPASFPTHNDYYVIAGAHIPIANDCESCHQGNYVNSPKTCYGCHVDNYNQTTDPNHITSQFSTTCETCHSQTAWSPSTFDHNVTYPLTGAHATIASNCTQCHTNGYANTPNTCVGCHQTNYNQSANPNHQAISIGTDCATCHTTNPGWSPATFPTHNNYYVIAGAHIPLTNDCASCHQGNYVNTPNTCYGCHASNFNQTTNPNHAAAQFPTTCADCHTQSAWTPSTFNHDGQYFPIYSGKHNGEWNLCSDCHTNPTNYAVFTCTTSCHPQSSTNNEHQGVGGYQYNSNACLACHPQGSAQGSFNHSTSPFPLTGGHAAVDCSSCHTNGYGSTSPVCASCHTPNYNQTSNPNHTAIGISNDCAVCHTTNPGWNPATFPTHNNYYVLAGAHVAITNQCADCHNGNYNSTPNTCAGCHINNYNQTTNPNHASAQFPTSCADCHTQTAWTPSTFNHDGQYFPIYSGSHNGQWNTCSECHTNPSNFAVFTCTTSCHPQSSTNNQHQGVGGYVYNSNECYACHPTGNAAGSFNHTTSPFPLTGGHASLDCSSCHANGYSNTSPVCASCHTPNYNQTTNPNHTTLGISTDCAVCHTTNPG